MPVKHEALIDDDGVVISTKDYCYTVFDNDKGYLYKNRTAYRKSFHDVKLSEAVKNKADFANVHILAENIYKGTNMVCYRRNERYYPADIKEISGMLDISERWTKDFIERMMMSGILAKNITNCHENISVQYYINPMYFSSNKFIPPALYFMFQKQLDQHLPKWVIARFHHLQKDWKK